MEWGLYNQDTIFGGGVMEGTERDHHLFRGMVGPVRLKSFDYFDWGNSNLGPP